MAPKPGTPEGWREWEDKTELNTRRPEQRAEPVSAADQWQHRTHNMLCKTCMYYVPKKSSSLQETPEFGSELIPELGRCRRHAPTMCGWPVMFPSDWCGDHKLDENAIT